MRPGLFWALPALSLLLFIFWQACLSSHPCLHLSCPLLAMKWGRSCFLLMSTEFLHTSAWLIYKPESGRHKPTKQKSHNTHQTEQQKNKTCVLSAKLLAMYTNKQLLKAPPPAFPPLWVCFVHLGFPLMRVSWKSATFNARRSTVRLKHVLDSLAVGLNIELFTWCFCLFVIYVPKSFHFNNNTLQYDCVWTNNETFIIYTNAF